VTRDEFVLRTRDAGIAESAYSIDGGDDDEKYVLAREGGGWSVYYSERGLRRNERNFWSESDAWDDVLARLVKDPTSRVR
jgi:hypothetical protein